MRHELDNMSTPESTIANHSAQQTMALVGSDHRPMRVHIEYQIIQCIWHHMNNEQLFSFCCIIV